MKRRRMLAKILAGLGALLVLLTVAQFRAHATPSSGLTAIFTVRGNNTSDGTIPLQAGTDIVMTELKVDGGGSSGWHSHPGGAIVVVQTGSLRVYRSIGSQCQIEDYDAGKAFIERPGEVDQVINLSSTEPYVLFVTFPRVPQGDSARIDVPNPGTCPGV